MRADSTLCPTLMNTPPDHKYQETSFTFRPLRSFPPWPPVPVVYSIKTPTKYGRVIGVTKINLFYGLHVSDVCFFICLFKSLGCFWRVIASVASKGFLASVRMFVIFQRAWSSARVTALIACKGFLSRMLPHVSLEITSLVGWIVALVTTEIPLPWVCWYVLFEVIRSCEGIDTQSAMK